MGNTTVNAILFQPPPVKFKDIHPSTIWLKTSTHNIIPAIFLIRSRAKFTLLYSHGNAVDLSKMYLWLQMLSERLNVHIFAYDYTGYGGSVGTPSETNCYADIDAAYTYLTQQRHIPPDRIILYGASVGSGPSVYLAVKEARMGRTVGGLLLHSPFMSVYRIVLNFQCSTMSCDKFPNIDRIGKVKCPTLILHGEQDTLISITHSHELYAAIPDAYKVKPYWAPTRGHNDIELDELAYLEKVESFVYEDCMRWNLNRRKLLTRRRVKGKVKLTRTRVTPQLVDTRYQLDGREESLCCNVCKLILPSDTPTAA